jgi:putative transcriptional regulator
MNERHEYFIKGQPLLPEPFHYTLSGLPNVYLLNGVVFHEDEGYGASYEIQDLDGLHDAIAAHIVERTGQIMTGAELRFLRKRMKKTQADLAGLLRVNEQTVANYEKGVTAVAGPADLAVRLVYMLYVLPPDAGKVMLDELTRMMAERSDAGDHLVPLHTGWDEVRIAA